MGGLLGAATASVLCCAGALGAAAAAAAGAAPVPHAPAPHAIAVCPGASLRPGAANVAAVDAATLCLIDRVRVAHHVPALRANRELAAVAASQVSAMVRWDYFADVRPGGQTPLALVFGTHYPVNAAGVSVGQNIGWGTGSYATPARVVSAWMASAPHRRVMLDGGYRDAGVAATPRVPSVKAGGRRGATYAIEFGLRRFARR
ncbi:MAG TPA: CAP domain-containing protein [Solirubrobacteraceae bacterium]